MLDIYDQVEPGTSRLNFQSIGGIRGLSAIDGPVSGKKSLIFVFIQELIELLFIDAV